jgi:hypothetical protein
VDLELLVRCEERGELSLETFAASAQERERAVIGFEQGLAHRTALLWPTNASDVESSREETA